MRCCSYGVVWGVEGEGGLAVRRYWYGRHRVELWRASEWLKNDEKHLKVKQSRQTCVYLGYIPPKTSTMFFGPMPGLVGRAFDLILECTCFWPGTDQVYLFLAAALFRNVFSHKTGTTRGPHQFPRFVCLILFIDSPDGVLQPSSFPFFCFQYYFEHYLRYTSINQ